MLKILALFYDSVVGQILAIADYSCCSSRTKNKEALFVFPCACNRAWSLLIGR